MSYLIEVNDLRKYFPIKGSIFKLEKKYVRAVDGVSLRMREGENLGLAGESGCGKTTLGKLISNLISPTSGTIKLFGKDIGSLTGMEKQQLRRNIQVVFQDPDGSLNPRQTIRQVLSKPFLIHKTIPAGEVKDAVIQLLNAVGLRPPESFINRYPHELSGGQRQRVGIARALALRPQLIIADEPVSALDVSVRAQILQLIRNLKEEFGLTYLFISHDLAVLRSICQRVTIMYLGKVVEEGSAEDIFTRPVHPYTKALLASTPLPNPHKTQWLEIPILEGEIPSPIDPPSGCRFHTRCPIAKSSCRLEEPRMLEVARDHSVVCWAVTDQS